MTAWIIISATLILVVLILWHGRSADFRRRSEYPKFQFLANLGLGPQRPSDVPPQQEQTPESQPEANHDHQP